MEKKIISTFLGFFVLLIISCSREAKPTYYYFSKDFKGEFVIIYGKKDGCPKKYKDGIRQLHIPVNGILVTQFEFSDGFRNDFFYREVAPGKYERLQLFASEEFLSGINDKDGYTSQQNIRAIHRGGVSGITTQQGEQIMMEMGAFIADDDLESLGGKLPDIVFKQIEKDSLSINCW